MGKRASPKRDKHIKEMGIVPNSSKITVVISIRATKEFWEKTKSVAEKQKTDTNKLIIKVVSDYCEGQDGGKRD